MTRMKPTARRACLLAVLATGTLAATPTPQPQMSFTRGASNTWNSDWQGIAGRSYFYQHSSDMVHWDYAPFIGYDAGIHSYGAHSSTAKGFFRLFYDDRPTDDPETDDFDGDGLSNLFEVKYLHTDPYVPNIGAVDSDGDGLADAWERFWFGSLTAQNGDDDFDHDGIPNKYEQQANTDPTKDETGDPDKIIRYSYDTEGRLLSVDDRKSATTTYSYDQEGSLGVVTITNDIP